LREYNEQQKSLRSRTARKIKDAARLLEEALELVKND
jgi:hypothetical protein